MALLHTALCLPRTCPRRGRGSSWQGKLMAGEAHGRGSSWQGKLVAGEARGRGSCRQWPGYPGRVPVSTHLPRSGLFCLVRNLGSLTKALTSLAASCSSVLPGRRAAARSLQDQTTCLRRSIVQGIFRLLCIRQRMGVVRVVGLKKVVPCVPLDVRLSSPPLASPVWSGNR